MGQILRFPQCSSLYFLYFLFYFFARGFYLVFSLCACETRKRSELCLSLCLPVSHHLTNKKVSVQAVHARQTNQVRDQDMGCMRRPVQLCVENAGVRQQARQARSS